MGTDICTATNFVVPLQRNNQQPILLYLNLKK